MVDSLWCVNSPCCCWWWWLESCKLLSWCCLDVRLWPRAEIPVWAWLRDNVVSVFKYRAGLPWGSRSVLKRPHDTGSLRRWPSVLECGSKSKENLISGSTTFYSWCSAQPLSYCHLFEVNSASMQVFCFWAGIIYYSSDNIFTNEVKDIWLFVWCVFIFFSTVSVVIICLCSLKVL